MVPFLSFFVLLSIISSLHGNNQNIGGRVSQCGGNNKVNAGDILNFGNDHFGPSHNQPYESNRFSPSNSQPYESNEFGPSHSSPYESGISQHAYYDRHFLRQNQIGSSSFNRQSGIPFQHRDHFNSHNLFSESEKFGERHQLSEGMSNHNNIPLLYSGYFKKAESPSKTKKKGKNGKSGPDSIPNVNIFSLMHEASLARERRVRRSLKEILDRKLAQKSPHSASHSPSRCTFKFSAGRNCKNLITHIISGRTANMDCKKEFLRFRQENGIHQYCENNALPKTSEHGSVLEIEHYKKSTTSGQSFKGYIICK